MNQIIAALKATCQITGATTLGVLFLITVGAWMDGIVREFEGKANATANAAAPAPLSPEAQEFLAITPRTEWPDALKDTTDERLVEKFLEGVTEGGGTLSDAQIQTVRTEVVPRMKELMARSLDQIQQDYWFWYWRGNAVQNALLKDYEANWGPKYCGAIAEIVNR